MKSNTKRELSKDRIRHLLSETVEDIKDITPLTAGEFNSAYLIDAYDKKYVLKVSPSRGTKVLSYEKNLMVNECNIHETILKETKVKVPEIVFKSLSQSGIDSRLLLTEYLDDAVPMHKVKMTPQQKGDLMFELGEQVARIHAVKGITFGYTHMTPHANWRDAYTVMLNMVISDTVKNKVKIPYHSKIVEYVNKHLNVLEEAEPTLTHFDIWAGNVFVDKDTKKLRGIIDMERGFYGDFCGDFISLDLFGDIENNEQFLEGYRNVRTLDITDNMRVRMNLLRLYLAVIIVAEAPVRYGKLSVQCRIRRLIAKKMIKKVIKTL